MRIGVPREIKLNERRVGLTPGSVRELANRGHEVAVEVNCGVGIGASDAEYESVGARILNDAKAVFDFGEMIVKVKEPQPQECAMLRAGQVLFTYLHLAADRKQTDLLIASGCTAIAYETVTDSTGSLPLLAPMSEVAGRMAVQAGAHCLEHVAGGSGILLGGVPGVAPAVVTILGGGVSGTHAALVAAGMGADVSLVEKSLPRMRQIDREFQGRVKTYYSNSETIEKLVAQSDLVIGAVLLPGATAPKLVSRALLRKMRPGSVVVDIAIDQGGCFETSRPTTHQAPTFVENQIVHYCVANMPGAVPRTSTYALNNATLPYVISIADRGWQRALTDDPGFANGLNIHAGTICNSAVAESFGLPFVSPSIH